MDLQTVKPENLTEADVAGLNRVAARAFGQTHNETLMLNDTRDHLAQASELQILRDNDLPVALAMYRSCLWRLCS